MASPSFRGTVPERTTIRMKTYISRTKTTPSEAVLHLHRYQSRTACAVHRLHVRPATTSLRALNLSWLRWALYRQILLLLPALLRTAWHRIGCYCQRERDKRLAPAKETGFDQDDEPGLDIFEWTGVRWLAAGCFFIAAWLCATSPGSLLSFLRQDKLWDENSLLACCFLPFDDSYERFLHCIHLVLPP